jgi:transposase
MQMALESFSTEVNPKQDKLIVLLLDQAGFHTAKNIKIPPGIEFYPLPPYTPELQPTECLWPLLREAAANRNFKTLDTLEQTLVKRSRWLIKNPDIVQAVCGFGWLCNILKRDYSD